MAVSDIIFLIFLSISWVWSIIWLVFFILRFKEIKIRLNYKDYIGLFGYYMFVLALIILFVFWEIEVRAIAILGLFIFFGGIFLLTNWVLYSIVNLIRKKEKINENIAIFGYIIEILLILFYVFSLGIVTGVYILIFLILIFLIFFFWSGTMVYTLIKKAKFREKEIKVKE